MAKDGEAAAAGDCRQWLKMGGSSSRRLQAVAKDGEAAAAGDCRQWLKMGRQQQQETAGSG